MVIRREAMKGNGPMEWSKVKLPLEIGGHHESIVPHLVRNIHLNEKSASNIKDFAMSSFGYTVLLGSMWANSLMDNVTINIKKARESQTISRSLSLQRILGVIEYGVTTSMMKEVILPRKSSHKSNPTKNKVEII